MTDLDLVQTERDAIALLGLLAHAYLTWDPPVAAGVDASGRADYTHYRGLNIQAALVDNIDGEVLALRKNAIHAHESPLAHAEQRVLKTATRRVQQKRPRPPRMSVEGWYRSRLFYGPGNDDEAFVTQGATLYTTLEPCPFCAAATCVSRVKRVVFIVDDLKFGGAWPKLKDGYYQSYELRCERLRLSKVSVVSTVAAEILVDLTAAIAKLRQDPIQDTWLLDHCRGVLGDALGALAQVTHSDLANEKSKLCNGRSLDDFKRLCRLPY